ncbi:hypothetical protein QR685DRAFT_584824 [Neurospora intermedia]|uniref:Uncharacterized protein n=1 Tax=Neurospora intermedia TaxID=5142 RepID=A0ABR3DF39_NEUIN
MANFLNQRRQTVSQTLVQNQQSLEDLQQRIQDIHRLSSDQEVKDFGDPKTASELDRQVREHNKLKQQLEDQARTLETYRTKTRERCETLEGIDRFDPAAMRERIESLDTCDADRLLKGYAEHIIADKVASLNTDNVENVLDIPVLNDMALTSDQRLLISGLFESFRTSVSQKYEEQNQNYKKTSEDQSRRLTELTENRDRVELENTRLIAANKRLEASQEAWKKAEQSLAKAQEHTKKAQAAQRIAEENLDERSSQLKECENKFQALEQQRGCWEAEKLQLNCEIDDLNTQLANARDYQEADQELQNQAALLKKTQKDAQNCLLKANSAERERMIAELRVDSIERQLQFEKVRIQSLENNIQTYRERYRNDQKEIQRLFRDLDGARSKLEDNCSRQREILDREAGLKEELRQSQRETRRLGQQVDILNSNVEEHQRVNNKLKQQAAEHEQAHATSMKQIRQLNIEKGNIETKLQQSY